MHKATLAYSIRLVLAAAACSTLAAVPAPANASGPNAVDAVDAAVASATATAGPAPAATPAAKQEQNQSPATETAQADQSAAAKTGAAKDQKSPAQGDDAAVTNLATVSVTGQLASLRQAQTTKMDAVGVVDSISAVEAGKFPDLNVADALQRVPGISVDRSSGEANQITVRGFGPTFVTVLLNGRTLASASTDRAFDFDTLASGIISQAVVHKTSSADMQAGGIGGTVNVITANPFDFRGFHASADVSGVNDHIGGGALSGKVTPKVSAIIGDSNASQTFGWLASVIYYKNDHQEQSVDLQGWAPGLDFTGLNPAYTNVSLPQTLQGTVYQATRTRKTFNGAITWKPIDDLSVDLNALYSEYKVDSTYHASGEFSNFDDIQSLVANENGTGLSYTRFNTGVLANDYIMESDPSDAKTEQTGAHIQYQFNNSTEMDLDTSVSRAWDKQSANGYFAVLGTRNIGVNPVWTNNGDNLLPSVSNILSTTDTSNLMAHCCALGGESPNVSDSIMENKLHFSKLFESGALERIDFGLYASDHKKTQVTVIVPDDFLCTEYCGYETTVPASAIDAYVFNAGRLVGGVSPGFPTQWIGYDANKYFAYLTTPEAYNQRPDPEDFQQILAANGGTFAARPNPQTYSKVRERIKAAYASAQFDGNIGNMPWVVNAGMRYTKTDTVSSAYSVPLLGITVNPNDTSHGIPIYGDISPISGTGSYSNWLPSADFKLNLLDNVIFRLAVSKTLTRPDISNLSVAQSFDFTPFTQRETSGNAALKPYTSKNIDAGLEWYINDSSYIAMDTFFKKVSNFVTMATGPVNILGFPFLVTEPINLNTAIVKGAEFTFNYQFSRLPFPFNGLGLASNYTYVTSSASVSPTAITQANKFAVPGIGNSSNLSIFYDQGPIELRLAYNWRQNYLSSIAGDEGQPTTVKAYGQLDFSGSYKINDHVSLYLDAMNLNNEKIYNYQVYLNQENYAEADGRMVVFGVRAKL